MDLVEILSASLTGNAPHLGANNASSSSSSSSSSQPFNNVTNTVPPAAPQLALIDFLVPGFSHASFAIRQYSGIDISIYIPFLAVLFGASFLWSRISDWAWSLINEHLVSSVRIRTDDEVYNIVIAWVANQPFSRRSRRFIANTNMNSRNYYSYSYDSDSEDEDDGYDPRQGKPATAAEKKPLHYTPAYGSNYFMYGWNLMLFQRDHERNGGNSYNTNLSTKEELVISSFGRSPEPIKKLLNDAREQYMKKDEHKTVIYRGSAGSFGNDPSWQRCMARAVRPLSTVILNDKVKTDLIDDVADYLNPATRKWYSNRGIPYRRGYLLYGPPGTGKSSLSLALAGYFHMKIYIVSLSSAVATEENLASLFVDLPRRCVVLLEDVDAAGLTHLRDANDGNTSSGSSTDGATSPSSLPPPPTQDGEVVEGPSLPTSSDNNRLTLSGLLNILDGVASQEGRLLVMTTNHLEHLDKALIRPGRVDRIVHFGLADAEMAADVFRAIYALYEGEKEPKSFQNDSEGKTVAKMDDTETAVSRVERLAAEFAQKLPSQEFSPAEIQGLLLRYKRDPEGAIEALDEWVAKTREDKREKEVQEAEERRKKAEEAKKAKEEEEEKKRKETEEAEEKKKKESAEEKKPEEEKRESNDEEKKD